MPDMTADQTAKVIARLDEVDVWLRACRAALEASPDLARKIIALAKGDELEFGES